MIGPIIVAVAAFGIVAIYIKIVNWFLRSDEHWNETPVQAPRPATAGNPTPEPVLSHAKA